MAELTYDINCVGTNAGWRYRVTIWCGRVAYQGQRTYERHQDAERAAKAAGAIAKDQIRAAASLATEGGV